MYFHISTYSSMSVINSLFRPELPVPSLYFFCRLTLVQTSKVSVTYLSILHRWTYIDRLVLQYKGQHLGRIINDNLHPSTYRAPFSSLYAKPAFPRSFQALSALLTYQIILQECIKPNDIFFYIFLVFYSVLSILSDWIIFLGYLQVLT